jgi:hypothetical protein
MSYSDQYINVDKDGIIHLENHTFEKFNVVNKVEI